MKIQREGKAPIIIGKRIVLGQGVLSGFNALAGTWDWLNPDNTVPALLVGGVAQVVTLGLQVWAVNKYGITLPEDD